MKGRASGKPPAARLRNALAAAAILGTLAGASAEVRAAPLVLASWNVEWLADAAKLQSSGWWSRCAAHPHEEHAVSGLPPCDAYGEIRNAAAYRRRKLQAVRSGLQKLASHGAQVIALQEVQDDAAVRQVLPAAYRLACVARGPGAQHAAFLVRQGLAATCEELPALALEGQAEPHLLRRGLVLRLREPAVSVLDLHLKAGCSHGARRASEACGELARQAAALQRWTDRQPGPLVVVGDFNRQSPASLVRGLDFAPVDRRAARSAGCHRELDHVGAKGLPLAAARLVAMPAGASDHCALEAQLGR